MLMIVRERKAFEILVSSGNIQSAAMNFRLKCIGQMTSLKLSFHLFSSEYIVFKAIQVVVQISYSLSEISPLLNFLTPTDLVFRDFVSLNFESLKMSSPCRSFLFNDGSFKDATAAAAARRLFGRPVSGKLSRVVAISESTTGSERLDSGTFCSGTGASGTISVSVDSAT